MSADLAAFIEAGYDAEEAKARKLLRIAQDVTLTLKDPAHLGKFMPGWHSWPDVEAMCTGRLADIRLKRAILAAYMAVADMDTDDPEPEFAYGRAVGLGEAARQLGTEFENAPGYRDEWRPET